MSLTTNAFIMIIGLMLVNNNSLPYAIHECYRAVMCFAESLDTAKICLLCIDELTIDVVAGNS